MTDIRAKITSFIRIDSPSPHLHNSTEPWRHLITGNHPWLYGQLKHVEALFEVLV